MNKLSGIKKIVTSKLSHLSFQEKETIIVDKTIFVSCSKKIYAKSNQMFEIEFMSVYNKSISADVT